MFPSDTSISLLVKILPYTFPGTLNKLLDVVGWEDRVREYVNERGVRGNALDWARRECMDRERWRSFCHGHPLGGRSWRERGVRAID